jgi:hypothetical protein
MVDYITTIEIDGENVDLDYNCAALVLYFNKLGLKTQFCCEGHVDDSESEYRKDIRKYYIIFDDDVTDEQIDKFVLKHKELWLKIHFTKWHRQFGDEKTCKMNWMFSCEYNVNEKEIFIKYLKKLFKKRFRWDIEMEKKVYRKGIFDKY